MSDTQRLNATLYVGGLSSQVSSQTLHQAFIPFGEITGVTLPNPELPSSTDPHRGFGYVEFESAEDAKEAMDNMDQSELFGRTIRVAAAKPQKNVGEGLGSKTAIWEQESWLSTNAVSEDDRAATDQAQLGGAVTVDPMQALEELDMAGPKPE